MVAAEFLEADVLRSYAVFAETCNFTTAARALHISQPALHVKIQKLAEALGERLYERKGRELFLTSEGVALARFARAQRANVDDFIAELKDLEDRPIALACGRGAFLDVIDAGIASALKQRLPLNFTMGNTPELIDMVTAGSADVAVGVIDRLPANLTSTVLASYGQNLVVRKSDSLTRLSKVTIRDLEGMALALPPERWPQRRAFDQVAAGKGVSFEVAAEAPGWDLLLRLAKLGVAPAVVNGCVPTPAGLVAIPIDGLPRVTYSALTRRAPSARVSQLVEILHENVR